MIKMSVEVEMSTDVNNLPTTSDSDSIDQNELVDKILAEMNSKIQNTSDNQNSLDNSNNAINTEIPITENTASPEKENDFETNPKPFNLKEVSTSYKPVINIASNENSIITNITNIPYRTIIYSTILSIFLYLLFTSKLATNILEQIPYMYYENNRTVLGGFLALGLFGFISLIGNYYIQLQF